MVPSNSTAVFYTGSITITSTDYRGFVATQATVVDAIAWGVGSDSAATLTPKMTIAAGTTIPVKFSAIRATGSFVAYK